MTTLQDPTTTHARRRTLPPALRPPMTIAEIVRRVQRVVVRRVDSDIG